MLSRICCLKGSNITKCMKQFNVPVAYAATCKTKLPKQDGGSGQRDLVNFPKPTRLERTPPTVFGFVPKSWFDFFYTKTGVTGGYTLLFGVSVYFFSKEYIVVSPEFVMFMAFLIFCRILHAKLGPLREFVEKKQMEAEKQLDSQQENLKLEIKETSELVEQQKWQLEGIATMLPEAKRENVYLQQEATYRTYLKEAHAAVLNILNYNVEKSNIERTFLQKHLTSWILNSVEAAITDDVKKVALEKAISDLKAMSAGG